jgi:hypothetical protein
MRNRQQRREEFGRLNAYLERLWNERPALAWLLTIGIALVILGLAELIRYLLTWA